MFQKKYLIIISIIICLLVLYYFYNEISSLKKLCEPTYQKTMSLDARLIQLEKKNTQVPQQIKKKPINNNIESPALSITYHSDRITNGNLSVKYSAISDTEAIELMNKLDNERQKQNIKQNIKQIEQYQQIPHETSFQKINETKPSICGIVQEDDFPELGDDKNIFTINDNKNDCFDGSETFNLKITDLINPNKKKITNNALEYNNNAMRVNGDNDEYSNSGIKMNDEYQKILNGLESNKINETDSMIDDEIDEDILKSITDSIKYADMPSENTLSDIPITPEITKKNRYQKKFKKSQNKKFR